MKVDIDKIKEHEIELTENIPVSEWDLDSFDVKFTGDIRIICKFARIGNVISVDARVATDRMIICSRCLSSAKQTVKQDFKLYFNVNDLAGKFLQIDSVLREELLINFPMKVLCSEDCKGLCPGCKANLNIEKCKCKQ